MDKIIKGICLGLSITLVFLSIFASAGFILNENNKNLNKQILKSDQYINMKENREIQKSSLSAKQSELQLIKDSYNQRINELAKVRDGYPSNYITRKENVQKEINQLNAEMMQELKSKNNELDNINSNLQQSIDISNIQVKQTSGYTSLFELMANLINKSESFKENPISSENLGLYFFIGISAIFEITALVLYVIKRKILSIIAFTISFMFTLLLMTSMSSGMLTYILSAGMALVLDLSKCLLMNYSIGEKLSTVNETLNNSNTSNEKPIIQKFSKPKFAMANKNTIGFKSDTLNSGDIEKYRNYMYETQKDGISKGYMSIAKDIGMNIETARKIKAHLEHSGIIETVGSRTIIRN